MQNKVLTYYKELPSWGKGAVSVIGVSLAAYLIYKVYNSIKEKRDLKEANIAAIMAEEELRELSQNGVRPTYSKSQYESFSQKLVEAMNGCGTTEESVYEVFKAMRNKADALSLISAFGIRYYRPCAATEPISYIKFLADNKAFGGPLQTWLEYDLDSSEIKKINDILKSNRVNYQF